MSEDAMNPDEIAKKAMELAARAEDLARHAHETAGIDEQLAQLEAELDALDSEEAGLNADAPDPATDQEPGAAPGWADQFTERVGSLGDRIGVLVEQVTEAALHRVDASLAGDGDAVEESAVDIDGPRVVRIDSYGGSVRVEAHSLNVVAVSARGRKLTEQSRLVDVEVHDRDVTITARNPHRWRGRGVRIDVRVPTGTDLVVATGGGSVTVDNVHGTADLRTGGGSLHLHGARGRAQVTSGGGSIELSDLDGAVTARTGGGGITIDGRLTGASSLRTGGGNITVRVAEGTNVHVDAHGTGSVTDFDTLYAARGRISGDIGDGTGGDVDAKTGGGTISITR